MAHLELPVRGNLHITLFHFEQMDDKKLAHIEEALAVIQHRVTKPPVATWGALDRFGRYRNISGARVEGAYVPALRKGIADELDRGSVLYSADYEYAPHVTKPSSLWDRGKPIPILPWVDLIWKDRVTLHFELA